MLFSALAPSFGLNGAVAASALLSLASGLLYRWRVLVHFPRLLPEICLWRLA
jgi:hypothetical protein